jgi:adenylate cyclase class 2
MNSEIEAKFADISIEDIRKKLRDLGATLEHPMRAMRRVLIEEAHHAAENSFIRIRDEGNRVTLTFKRRTAPDHEATIDSVKELETTVGDFDTTVKIFEEAGWNYITYQETRRETWLFKSAEVVIDEWPWLNPSLEIEASSVELVQDVASQLGLKWDDAIFGSIDILYERKFPRKTNRGVIDIKEVRFDAPVPKEFLG